MTYTIYNPNTTYAIGAIVQYNGMVYRAKSQNVGNVPDTNPVMWEVLGTVSSTCCNPCNTAPNTIPYTLNVCNPCSPCGSCDCSPCCPPYSDPSGGGNTGSIDCVPIMACLNNPNNSNTLLNIITNLLSNPVNFGAFTSQIFSDPQNVINLLNVLETQLANPVISGAFLSFLSSVLGIPSGATGGYLLDVASGVITGVTSPSANSSAIVALAGDPAVTGAVPATGQILASWTDAGVTYFYGNVGGVWVQIDGYIV